MRRSTLAGLVLPALINTACSSPTVDGDRMVSAIIDARADLDARHSSGGEFTYRPSPGPYVIVLAPPQALTQEAVAAMELPVEAREFLEPDPGVQLPTGPLFILVRPDRADWHQLRNVASLPRLLYVWKRAGEEATLTLRVQEGRTEIVAIR